MTSTTLLADKATETELIIPVEFDQDDLEVLATTLPTPFCGGTACGVCLASAE
ncbi:hypothetical protein ACPZ13_19475 [Streptomyces sp. IPPR8]|uniref:hypothetical protein n=1 Tax=unclassified Streptomyces TaxID=2593676 RepID=UPI001E597C37|nr:hypothetical protein [Streptomyces sp. DH1]